MRLKEEDREVVTSGGMMGEQGFSIDEASMHIVMDVLRSKVYSNPIGSLCREIVSNSRDAHREAGVTDPVEVQIRRTAETPGMWDGDGGGVSIVFRDHGTGISPDRMRDVYSKYGASTKRGTNDLTGGFGLGAKTPFAYVDAFSVVTVYDGTRYTYQVYIDQTQKGVIALLDTEPAQEHNGTEIIVPLQRKDIDTFEREVLKCTHFWDVRPVLTGFNSSYAELHAARTSAPKEKEGVYRLLAPRGTWANTFIESPVNVVVDGIYYPVDTNITKQEIPGASIVFPFNNGELTVSANREQLQYDDATKELIEARMEEARAFIAAGYDGVFAQYKTLLDAIEGDAGLRQSDAIYKDLVEKKARVYVHEGREYVLDRTPWTPRAHSITGVSSTSNSRGSKTEIYRLDAHQLHKGPVYVRAHNAKPRPGTWRTLLDRHPHFVLITQKDPAMEGQHHLADPEGYYADVAGDARLIEQLGIPVRDFEAVDVEKLDKPPAEKSKVVLRTATANGMTRETYKVVDGEVFADGGRNTPVQLVVHWMETEAVALRTSEAYLLRDLANIVGRMNARRDPKAPNPTKEIRVVAASKSKAKKLGPVTGVDEFIKGSVEVRDYVHFTANAGLIADVVDLDVTYPTVEQRIAHRQLSSLRDRVRTFGSHNMTLTTLVAHVEAKKLVQPLVIEDPIGDRTDFPLLSSLDRGEKKIYVNQIMAMKAEIASLRQQLHGQEESKEAIAA